MSNLDYSHGYSGSGIEQLISDVNSIVMSGAGKKAIDNLNIITDACDQYWDGEAKENFKKNLKKDAELFKNNLQELETAFETEIRNAGESFRQFDKNLID